MLTIRGSKSVEQLLEENENYMYHYWFGGDVAEFESDRLPGYVFCLGAYGDVRATLIEKSSGVEIEYVRDKRNMAGFYRALSYYFDDNELKLLLNDNSSKYILNIYNNNWWECYAINEKTNRIIELGDTLNADLLSEAIREIKDLEDNYVAWIMEEDEEANSFIVFGNEQINDEPHYYVQIEKGTASQFVADHIKTRNEAMLIAAQKGIELGLEVKEW